MDINAFNQREMQLQLREKLIDIEEKRRFGVADSDAREAGRELRERILAGNYAQS
ncbi:MAG: hypothetical protein LUG56_05475 [Lachnospiraceae bacterium]|nr:hypothetical protein [Lachnospiraceae bacterium]MCD7841904.1 hypothetical protein [Lachnospiraceae bacterium]